MELRVEQLRKTYGDNLVLKDVSFTVTSGNALGLLGRNGAGKTTAIRILTDIFRADSGSVLLDGAAINYKKIKMGYLPEERGLYPKIKVGEQMIYIGRLKGKDAKAARQSASSLLEELEVSEYWGKKLETLSKGNQQKIQLAIAVLHDPDIIILDEPFSGLDPVNAQMLKNLINRQVQRGKLVLFSSHQMPYVEEFCQHICILSRGSIVLDGKIKDIKKTYPRSRIAITPEEPAGFVLNELTEARLWPSIVESAAVLDDQIMVTLKSPGDKAKLFSLLSERGVGVDSFYVVEPTLEEIFVDANQSKLSQGGGAQ